MTSASPDAEALVERRGRAGVIILNRPKALNALTLAMVRIMAPALDAWERDRLGRPHRHSRRRRAGVLRRRRYSPPLRPGPRRRSCAQRAFWREEYQLDRRIRTYPKPIVALVDGIDMGGGVGLSLNASHCVASERFVFAMPEVGIGFFPDVGATWFLPRLPFRSGAYFALTGLRADAGDAVALGLAQAYVPSASFPALIEALQGEGTVEAALARFASPAPRSALMEEAAEIEACFSLTDREAILAALAALRAKGPRLRVAGAQSDAREVADQPGDRAETGDAWRRLDFDEALSTEYRVVSRICRGHDFYEGVRAVIVDKDNRPRWAPPPSRRGCRRAISRRSG